MTNWTHFAGVDWKMFGLGVVCLAIGLRLLRNLVKSFDHDPLETISDIWDNDRGQIGWTVIAFVGGALAVLIGVYCFYLAFTTKPVA